MNSTIEIEYIGVPVNMNGIPTITFIMGGSSVRNGKSNKRSIVYDDGVFTINILLGDNATVYRKAGDLTLTKGTRIAIRNRDKDQAIQLIKAFLDRNIWYFNTIYDDGKLLPSPIRTDVDVYGEFIEMVYNKILKETEF